MGKVLVVVSILLGILYYILTTSYCYYILCRHKSFKGDDNFIISLLFGWIINPIQIVYGLFYKFIWKLILKPFKAFLDFFLLGKKPDSPPYYKIFYTKKEYDDFCRKLQFNNTLDNELK